MREVGNIYRCIPLLMIGEKGKAESRNLTTKKKSVVIINDSPTEEYLFSNQVRLSQTQLQGPL